jgi:hypothetical protein
MDPSWIVAGAYGAPAAPDPYVAGPPAVLPIAPVVSSSYGLDAPPPLLDTEGVPVDPRLLIPVAQAQLQAIQQASREAAQRLQAQQQALEATPVPPPVIAPYTAPSQEEAASQALDAFYGGGHQHHHRSSENTRRHHGNSSRSRESHGRRRSPKPYAPFQEVVEKHGGQARRSHHLSEADLARFEEDRRREREARLDEAATFVNERFGRSQRSERDRSSSSSGSESEGSDSGGASASSRSGTTTPGSGSERSASPEPRRHRRPSPVHGRARDTSRDEYDARQLIGLETRRPYLTLSEKAKLRRLPRARGVTGQSRQVEENTGLEEPDDDTLSISSQASWSSNGSNAFDVPPPDPSYVHADFEHRHVERFSNYFQQVKEDRRARRAARPPAEALARNVARRARRGLALSSGGSAAHPQAYDPLTPAHHHLDEPRLSGGPPAVGARLAALDLDGPSSSVLAALDGVAARRGDTDVRKAGSRFTARTVETLAEAVDHVNGDRGRGLTREERLAEVLECFPATGGLQELVVRPLLETAFV